MPNKRKSYALWIITVFPSLKDPFSLKGYVSIIPWLMPAYISKICLQVNCVLLLLFITGTLLWFRQRNRVLGNCCYKCLSEDVKYSRISSGHDSERTTDVFKIFPHFLDIKGLVRFWQNHDFYLKSVCAPTFSYLFQINQEASLLLELKQLWNATDGTWSLSPR